MIAAHENTSVRTVDEAAQQLRKHPDTIRRHLRDGVIPGARVGGSWRITQKTIEEILAGKLPESIK